nr:hypothetical protein [Candidatus Paracaedibacter symbiosus]
MGKTQVAHEKSKIYKISEADHDLFLDKCLKKCPQIFPTFQLLTPSHQEQLKRTKGLVHLGHVTHVEGGPEILEKLKNSTILRNNPRGFDFEILTHICDVSAARGHENNAGSKVMTENTFKTIEVIKEALHYLSNHSEQEALKHYLSQRASWLGINLSFDEEYTVARIGAMMRLYTKEDGKILQEAFSQIKPKMKSTLLAELNPLIIRQERTPTYIPAVLVNLMSAYTKQELSREDSIHQCVTKGVPLIAEILHAYRHNKANIPYNINLTLNFNKIAGQLRDNVELAENNNFTIDPQGNVELVQS